MQSGYFRALRVIALVLFCSVFLSGVAYATDAPPDAASTKQMLEKRGVGKMVKIKQADGKELRAKIVSIGETSAVLQVSSKKPPVEVPYGTVAEVKGPGLSKGVKITIVVAIVWIALGIVGAHTV